jgi:conjugative relaxase-like TrwC/TraI family protein
VRRCDCADQRFGKIPADRSRFDVLRSEVGERLVGFVRRGRRAAIDLGHRAAVDAALSYLEEHASMSRRGRDGVDQISSAGFAGALFDHTTPRTGDPELHTHALVVNKVRCADGGWRALDGREIYHHKKSAGAIYQATLRAELAGRLSVAFGAVSEHGQAEIAGVPEDLMGACMHARSPSV